MGTGRQLGAAVFALILGLQPAQAQTAPKPGPEQEILKKLEGNWDATMSFAGSDSKGTMTYKMELGGLWLTSSFEGDFGGAKFTGKGLDTYETGKKKFVSVWADSMSTTPLIMEGTYDKDKKAMTMTGEGPGMDGKPAKWKSVTELIDDNNMKFGMYLGDGKEPMFTITYKRKK